MYIQIYINFFMCACAHTYILFLSSTHALAHTYTQTNTHKRTQKYTHTQNQPQLARACAPEREFRAAAVSCGPLAHLEGCVKINMHELRVWMRHVTHMNESCHTYECIMSHAWISDVTHMTASCHARESCLTHMNASCYTCEWPKT